MCPVIIMIVIIVMIVMIVMMMTLTCPESLSSDLSELLGLTVSADFLL